MGMNQDTLNFPINFNRLWIMPWVSCIRWSKYDCFKMLENTKYWLANDEIMKVFIIRCIFSMAGTVLFEGHFSKSALLETSFLLHLLFTHISTSCWACLASSMLETRFSSILHHLSNWCKSKESLNSSWEGTSTIQNWTVFRSWAHWSRKVLSFQG